MSKFAPILPRLEIECWILGVEMSSYWVSLIAMGTADHGSQYSQTSHDSRITKTECRTGVQNVQNGGGLPTMAPSIPRLPMTPILRKRYADRVSKM